MLNQKSLTLIAGRALRDQRVGTFRGHSDNATGQRMRCPPNSRGMVNDCVESDPSTKRLLLSFLQSGRDIPKCDMTLAVPRRDGGAGEVHSDVVDPHPPFHSVSNDEVPQFLPTV